MNRKNYIRFRNYDIWSTSTITVVWSALISYSIMLKSNLGIELVNTLELVVIVLGIVGVNIGYRNRIQYKHIILFDILLDLVFVIVCIYLIFVQDLYNLAIFFYITRFIMAVYTPAKRESERHYEDFFLTKGLYKAMLKSIREKYSYFEIISATLGASLSIIFINVLKVDVNHFVIGLFVFNLINNIFDLHRWNKYLR